MMEELYDEGYPIHGIRSVSKWVWLLEMCDEWHKESLRLHSPQAWYYYSHFQHTGLVRGIFDQNIFLFKAWQKFVNTSIPMGELQPTSTLQYTHKSKNNRRLFLVVSLEILEPKCAALMNAYSIERILMVQLHKENLIALELENHHDYWFFTTSFAVLVVDL